MEVENTIWKATLESFQGKILGGDSITGGVAVAAVSGAFAVSVLQMVLEIAVRKTESARIRQLIEEARTESARLAQLADEDREAYAAYREAARLPKASEEERAVRRRAMARALCRATETPLAAVRSAVSAIGLCVETAGLVEGQIAADVGGAAALLAGAARAILHSVEANLRAQLRGLSSLSPK